MWMKDVKVWTTHNEVPMMANTEHFSVCHDITVTITVLPQIATFSTGMFHQILKTVIVLHIDMRGAVLVICYM